jgi:Tol biopolymer transport system component
MSGQTIAAGTRIGAYRIDGLIGEGGMGVVYHAFDVKLNRPAAIKFLSSDIADAALRRRFQREAQTASALNHPHILTVYDAGEIDGRQYLITEFVDGGTLREWFASSPRTWRQIVEILTGVADALAVAHEAGILHRDIKPENVLVTRSGYAKLADFGLAKLDERMAQDSAQTFTAGQTRAGVIMGTAAYMSPEQAIGRSLDARSDVFSFGILLYELLAGRRPFNGESALDVLHEIAHAPPKPLEGEAPLALRMIVDKALEKDPADRYQTMRELVVDLRRLARRSGAEVPMQADTARSSVLSAPRQRRLNWVFVLAAAVLAGVIGWVLRSTLGTASPARGVQVQRLTDLIGLEEAPALSPDGKTVAFVAVTGGKRQVWIRLLAGGAPLVLTKDDADHYSPRWSPDSGSLIYYTPGAQPGDSGTIWEIPALGGPARRLVSALGPGDLSHDGTRLAFFRFRDGASELAVAPRDQLEARTITKLPAGVASYLRWSPDDQRLMYMQEVGGFTFSTDVMVADVSGGAPRRVATGRLFQGATWLSDGSGLIVSSSDGSLMPYPPTYNLWQVSLDGGTRSQLTFGESSYEFPDLGAQGNLVVSRVRAQANVWKFPITEDPVENVRKGIQITRQTGVVQTVSVSPDESRLVFLSDNGGHANVWSAQVADGEMRPVTQELDPRVVVAVPVWSPRGDWINFLSNRNSTTSDVTLWLTRPDGSDARDLGIVGAWACWSADGLWLYFSDSEDGVYRIRKVRADGGDPELVRNDNAIGCNRSSTSDALYYARILAQATGAWDFELRVATPEDGPSKVIGTVSGSRVPATAINFHAFPSPDGRWLAMPLIDGSTTNLWAVSTEHGEWRKLTEFGQRNVVIARRIAWSGDGRHMYASVSDVDSDIVLLAGLE